MVRISKVAYAALAVAVMGCAVPGFSAEPASRPGRGEGRPDRPPIEMLLRDQDGFGKQIHEALQDLNLTDDQKAQIKKIMEDAKSKMEEWRTAHKDELQKLREDIKAAHETKDREKVRQIMEKAKELLESCPVKPREVIDKIKDVLTAEQNAKFDAKLRELREKAQERRQERREDRGEGQGPASRPARK